MKNLVKLFAPLALFSVLSIVSMNSGIGTHGSSAGMRAAGSGVSAHSRNASQTRPMHHNDYRNRTAQEHQRLNQSKTQRQEHRDALRQSRMNNINRAL